MGASGSFGQLIMNTNALVVAPVVDGYLIPLMLHEIFIRRLRERTYHNCSAAFVKVSVVGTDNVVLTTPASSASTAPSWPLEKPVRIAVTPSSIIRFSVFRHHRVRPCDLIAEVEGTAWTFLDSAWVAPQKHSKDSPDMTLKAVMRIADIEHSQGNQNEAEGHLECEMDRLSDLGKRYEEKAGQWKTLQDGLLEALKSLIKICQILEKMAEGLPLCKAASVFLQAVIIALEKMIEKRKRIDSDILQLIQSLYEVVVEASRGACDVKHEAAKIAGECAVLFDKWISTTLGVQFLKAAVGSVDEHVNEYHERLSSFKSKLKEKMKSATHHTAHADYMVGSAGCDKH